MSDAAFPLFLTASISFPDLVRDLVRPRKIVRICEAFLLLLGKLRERPLPIGPDVESVVNGSLRKRIHRTAHISALPCVGEEPVLSFQLFREGSRGSRNPHDGHKDGEAGPGRSREIHRLCPHTAWKTSQEDIDKLLPWPESLPEEVRSSKYEIPKSTVDSIKKDKYE